MGIHIPSYSLLNRKKWGAKELPSQPHTSREPVFFLFKCKFRKFLSPLFLTRIPIGHIGPSSVNQLSGPFPVALPQGIV